jgi:hypothetical protein
MPLRAPTGRKGVDSPVRRGRHDRGSLEVPNPTQPCPRMMSGAGATVREANNDKPGLPKLARPRFAAFFAHFRVPKSWGR